MFHVKHRMSRYRIGSEPAARPRSTSAYALQAEPSASQDAVSLDRDHKVFRTRRCVAALPGKDRRQHSLIYADSADQYALQRDRSPNKTPDRSTSRDNSLVSDAKSILSLDGRAVTT